MGKSSVARRLASLLSGKYVSIDTILEKHNLDKIDEKEGCIPVKNFLKAMEMELPKIMSGLAKGKVFVIDGNFYHKEQIERLIRKLDAPHYVFTLKASLEVCLERDRKREKAYGEISVKRVYDLVSRFDIGTVIDTKHKDLEQVVNDILSYLPQS